jgi:hypothetical protein
MLVSIAIRDGLVHFVTATNSGKAKRLRRNSRVSLVTRAGARRAANEPVEGHPTPAPESGWERCTAVRQADALVGRKLSLVPTAARRPGAISVVLDPPGLRRSRVAPAEASTRLGLGRSGRRHGLALLSFSL